MVTLFRHQLPIVTLLRLVLETSFFFLAIIIGVMLSGRDASLPYGMLPAAMLFAGVMVGTINAFGLYRRDPGSRPVGVAARLTLALLVGVPAAYVAFYFVPESRTYQESLGLTVVITLFGVLVLRRGFLKSLDSKLLSHRVMVLGTGHDAQAVAAALSEIGSASAWFVGFYPLPSEEEDVVPADRVLSAGEALQEIGRAHV